MTGWRYYYRRYLGFLPVQFCMVCGRAYWAGWPSFEWEHGCWFMPWMVDYCSRECCDVDMEIWR